MNYLAILSMLCFGFAAGIAVGWADHIQTERKHAKEKAEIAADLNACRVMAEWDKFESERGIDE